MRKGILILLGMFMMVSTAEANHGEKLKSNFGVNYRYNDAITFNERGVDFHIFLNGDFDFNTRNTSSYLDYNGKRTKRGIKINRDFNGKIRSIGNVFINYDHRGNVKRIGNVFMSYHQGNLTKVGNLKIKYNNWGDPYFYGRVKRNNQFYDGYGINISIGSVCDYNDTYFYRPKFRKSYRQFKEDNNFYYYRAKPNAKIGKRSKVLKRRKTTSPYYKNKKLKKITRPLNHAYKKDAKKKKVFRSNKNDIKKRESRR